MVKPFARLRHSQATKDKISNSKKGRPRSEETKEKIRQARLGTKLSPETIAKITAKRRARAAMTDAEIAEECRLRNEAKDWHATNERIFRWKQDQLTAIRIGNKELFADVKQSDGHTNNRRMKDVDPRVSNGYCRKRDKVIWPVQ